jgi:hypothetical protein
LITVNKIISENCVKYQDVKVGDAFVYDLYPDVIYFRFAKNKNVRMDSVVLYDEKYTVTVMDGDNNSVMFGNEDFVRLVNLHISYRY